MIPVYTLLKEINVACFHPEPIHLNYLKVVGIYSSQCFGLYFPSTFFTNQFFRCVLKPCSVLPLRTEKERVERYSRPTWQPCHVPVYIILLAVNVFTATHTICKSSVLVPVPEKQTLR